MRAILIIIALSTITLSGCDFFQNKRWFSNDVDTLEAYNRRQDSIHRVDSLKKVHEIEKKRAEKARKDSIRMAEERHRRLYKFHIVVGSFKTPKYARAYNEFIKQKGYKTEMLTNKYKFQMVSIGAYKSWSTAVSDLNKAREELIETAWIYIDET